jgi:chromosome segregation ATPase
MDMNAIITVLLGIVGVLLTIMGYYYNKNRNIKTDMDRKLESVEKKAQEYGGLVQKIETLNVNIVSLSRSLSDRIISIETRAEDKLNNCNAHTERLIKTEAKADSAHKRLDEHRDLFSEINRKLDQIIKAQREE